MYHCCVLCYPILFSGRSIFRRFSPHLFFSAGLVQWAMECMQAFALSLTEIQGFSKHEGIPISIRVRATARPRQYSAIPLGSTTSLSRRHMCSTKCIFQTVAPQNRSKRYAHECTYVLSLFAFRLYIYSPHLLLGRWQVMCIPYSRARPFYLILYHAVNT